MRRLRSVVLAHVGTPPLASVPLYAGRSTHSFTRCCLGAPDLRTPRYCEFCDPLPQSLKPRKRKRIHCRNPHCSKDGFQHIPPYHVRQLKFELRNVKELWNMSNGLFHLLSCGHLVSARDPRHRRCVRRRCPTCSMRLR